MATVFTILGGTLTERPTTAEEGRIFEDFETGLRYRYLGGQWIEQQPPVNHPPYYTAAEVAVFIDGITSLSKARLFLKLLVKYVTVKK